MSLSASGSTTPLPLKGKGTNRNRILEENQGPGPRTQQKAVGQRRPSVPAGHGSINYLARRRQQQPAAVMGFPWKLLCPSPALPVPTAVVMETVSLLMRNKGWGSAPPQAARAPFSLLSPCAHTRGALGKRSRALPARGFASPKARSPWKICPARRREALWVPRHRSASVQQMVLVPRLSSHGQACRGVN